MHIILKKEITGSVLDVGGGGEGVIGRIYKEQVTAIDNEQQELDEAPDCCRKVLMDARSLEFQNESFDNATAFYSFMYMSTDAKEKAASEISRVLKPGGRLYIWDAEIASAEKEPFLADLDVDAAGEKIETTYGIMGEDIAQSAEYFIRLCSKNGFSLLEKSEHGGHFYLVFEKTHIRKETEHFVSFYSYADEPVAEHFISDLEENYRKIHGNFSFEPKNEKYIFFLCRDTDEYIELTGKTKEDYESWMVGNSNFEKKLICLLSPEAAGEDENYLRQVLIHELVHMIFDSQAGGTENEAWIAEGIAILYANQTDPRYIDPDNFPKISDISGICTEGETPDNFIDNGGYDYAGIYVWHFIKKYGFQKFLTAYKNEADLASLVYNGFETEAVKEYLNVCK